MIKCIKTFSFLPIVIHETIDRTTILAFTWNFELFS